VKNKEMLSNGIQIYPANQKSQRNAINVACVRKLSLILHPFVNMRKIIVERNYLNVKNVQKPLAKVQLLFNIK
jgi:hypothetical protein